MDGILFLYINHINSNMQAQALTMVGCSRGGPGTYHAVPPAVVGVSSSSLGGCCSGKTLARRPEGAEAAAACRGLTLKCKAQALTMVGCGRGALGPIRLFRRPRSASRDSMTKRIRSSPPSLACTAAAAAACGGRRRVAALEPLGFGGFWAGKITFPGQAEWRFLSECGFPLMDP
uniref:Uncharacterized protein n=1 Tax=Oryza punctata TaxID=4537 RepID=A0A0E0LH20_ORYPU